MPRVGDGTGMGGGTPPEDQALTSNEDAKPESPGRGTGQGQGGMGPKLAEGGNRNSPHGGGKS